MATVEEAAEKAQTAGKGTGQKRERWKQNIVSHAEGLDCKGSGGSPLVPT